MSLMYCALSSNGSGWIASFIYVYQNMLAMFSPWCQQYPKLHCDSSSTASKCCGQHKMYYPLKSNNFEIRMYFYKKINIQIYSQIPLVLTYLLLVNQNKFDGRKMILAFSIILLSNSNSTSFAFKSDSNYLLSIKITGLH